MSRYIFVSAFLAFAFMSGAAWGETMYVKPDEAKILSKFPGPGSKVIATVYRGDALKILKKSGKYYRVKTGMGVIGYIARSRLSDSKIGDGSDDLDQLFGDLDGDQRTAKMDERSSSHSIRGLKRKNPPGKSRVTSKQAQNYVKQMEKFSVSYKESAIFQKEGKVGFYAK
jgi:uncharacterized protein YgiM (DUF1202 family)